MFMKNLKKWGIVLCAVAALMGCEQQYDHKGKTPLVEVAAL